ncbi:hypothetical protein INT48_001624 [Thamnidium elegans]|uniref:Exonuclease domain-containing protein n=1 Tax=Thamnidium elegans TaxID=101142 RepID=A0A8H7SRQ6_9FUNG|nr:hypothetical protein INT48_001624 [Thamnidium elegans]
MEKPTLTTVEGLRLALEELGLNTKEATCIEGGGFKYDNEIIEFPVDEFRSYIKPTINPTLSQFCINLTGIEQSTIDQSPTFIEVLNQFQGFLARYDLFQSASASFVTDGPFDIRDFITKQCKHSKIKKRPAYFDIPWVNIRKLFKDFYGLKENKNINGMLNHLQMQFKGREHSGLDDARNLAAIGKRMHEEGCIFKTNCKFNRNKRPQLKENYKRQNGDGLSLTFLIIWLAGDLFNLAGIIMEKLMFLLALWYTMADICLIWQVIYYKQTVTPNEPEMISLAMETVVERPKESALWINIIGFTTLIFTTLISVYAYMMVPNDAHDDSIRLMPQIMGWSSAILYVGSRLPQIIKNWRQQSTDGLSPGMFICAVFGNLFFTLSIFLKSTEPRYIIVNLSWIIGSLGTVIFDLMIFLQFYVFNRRSLKRRAD